MLTKKMQKRILSINLKKVFLGITLMVLLWSRVLASYSTISNVHASYTDNLSAGEIKLPQVESQEEIAVSHVNTQIDVEARAANSVPLQMLEQTVERAERIRNFYAKWNAPMAAQAEYLVIVADEFGLDWRLLPAISIVESSGGNYCFKSYNPFGWGRMDFASFEDAIYTVAAGLANGYGTDNPYAIGPTYNPVTPESWSNKVAGLMAQM